MSTQYVRSSYRDYQRSVLASARSQATALNRIAAALECDNIIRSSHLKRQAKLTDKILKLAMPALEKVIKDTVRPPKPFVFPGNPLRKRRTPRRAHRRL